VYIVTARINSAAGVRKFMAAIFNDRLNRLVRGKSNKLGYYHEEKAKTEGTSKVHWYFVVFIFSDDFELHA